nr:MAG TPA: hypothetical protein [Caudoviricetes sp.]
MTTKWFDYRLMHPMQATYYFFRKRPLNPIPIF